MYDFKFFDTAYVTMQKRPASDIQNKLAIAMYIPDGTDKAALARRETANRWAYGYGGYTGANGQIAPVSIPNSPAVGFKFTGGLRNASQGSSDTAFRIEDPRGYELEVRASNVVYLMQNCTIENMEIQSECVWVRNGSTNWLIPTSSKEWNDILESKKSKETGVKVKINNIPLGSKVFLKNGLQGIWLGQLYALYKDTVYRGKFIDGNEKHYFILAENLKSQNKSLCGTGLSVFKTKPDIVSVIPTEQPYSVEQVVDMINDYIQSDITYAENKSPVYSFNLFAVDKVKMEDLKYTLSDTMTYEYNNKQYRYNLAVVDDRYLTFIGNSTSRSLQHCTAISMSIDDYIKNGNTTGVYTYFTTHSNSHYGSYIYTTGTNIKYVKLEVTTSTGKKVFG